MKPELRRFLVVYGPLVAIGLVGVFLIYLGHSAKIVLLEHFGSALIVGAVIGGTVDLAVKTDLVADAVKAALGWVLPAPLRPELAKIYEQALIWRDTKIEVHVEEVKQGVIARCEIRRTLENVSTKTANNVHIRFSVDEWGIPDLPTHFSAYGFRWRSNTYDLNTPHLVKVERSTTAIDAFPDFPVNLNPGEKVECWFTYEEVRAINDQLYLTHRYPIAGVEVAITSSEGIDFPSPRFHFSGKYDQGRDLGGGRYKTDGTLLAHQAIVFRWHKKGWSGANLPMKLD